MGCPECFSANIERVLTMHDDRQDDEHMVTITKYKCKLCACEFQTVERVEWETEILKHGSQASEGESEE
jgi:transcriptional regulator NrdR family protein